MVDTQWLQHQNTEFSAPSAKKIPAPQNNQMFQPHRLRIGSISRVKYAFVLQQSQG
jgi:hypothetical protein